MWGEAPNNLLLLQKNKKSWYSSSYVEEDILYKSIFVKKNIYPWEFYNYRFCLQIFSVREGVTQDGDELVVLLLVPQCQVFVWHCHSNTPAAFDTHVTSSIFLISLHLLNAPPPPHPRPPIPASLRWRWGILFMSAVSDPLQIAANVLTGRISLSSRMGMQINLARWQSEIGVILICKTKHHRSCVRKFIQRREASADYGPCNYGEERFWHQHPSLMD